MIWPWLLFDYYHPKSPKSRFVQCFQWFSESSEKLAVLVKNRAPLENTAFYQLMPENSDCWYVFCSAIMKHSGGFKPFTKVTSPLGSIAWACRFKSCRAHHNAAVILMELRRHLLWLRAAWYKTFRPFELKNRSRCGGIPQRDFCSLSFFRCKRCSNR